MKADPNPAPGSVCLTCGALIIGLSVTRSVSGMPPVPGSFWFELGTCVVGLSLVAWGWSRLRRAKAAQPDQSWWRFLHAELIALGIIVVVLPIWMSIPPDERNRIFRALGDVLEAVVTLRFGH